VAAGRAATAPIFVTAPRGAFDDGRRAVQLRISDGAGWSTLVPYRLLGPEDDDEDDDEHDRENHESKEPPREGDRARGR
jgi:hypothetical protein